MLEASDLGGVMAMMPAFAKDTATDLLAVDTVDTSRLRAGVDQMVRDGANVIATTGSFGECHTLLEDEFRVLARETVDVVARRVPLFIGVTSVNARETVQKMRIVAETAADGVLLGVPYYFPSTVDNAVRFYKDIVQAFPSLNVMIYHNPALHNVTLPVEAFEELIKMPQVIGMKDSHRDPVTFMKLQKIISGRVSVMCNQLQYSTYAQLGAAGFWSIDAWMGPWPLLALRDAVANGDLRLARHITLDIAGPGSRKANLSWRETAAKLSIAMAGYVVPGPLRPPFLEIPDDVLAAQRKRAERWKGLCAKYVAASTL